MNESDKIMKEEIAEYVILLKKHCGLSIKQIAKLSKKFGYKFSQTLLFKVYKKNNSGEFTYYDIPMRKLKQVADTLRSILRFEANRNSLFKTAIKNIDLDKLKDYTELVEPFLEPDFNIAIFLKRKYLQDEDVLIPLETSLQLEANAARVCSFTRNLFLFLNHIDAIKSILKTDSTKRFHVILTDKKHVASCSAVRRHIENAGLEHQFIIHELYQLSPFTDWGYIGLLPNPYDVVIYEKTKLNPGDRERTIAIMSTYFASPARSNESSRKRHQDMIVDKLRVPEIIELFEFLWQKLENQKTAD